MNLCFLWIAVIAHTTDTYPSADVLRLRFRVGTCEESLSGSNILPLVASWRVGFILVRCEIQVTSVIGWRLMQICRLSGSKYPSYGMPPRLIKFALI
jgi:hypothetical protein